MTPKNCSHTCVCVRRESPFHISPFTLSLIPTIASFYRAYLRMNENVMLIFIQTSFLLFLTVLLYCFEREKK